MRQPIRRHRRIIAGTLSLGVSVAYVTAGCQEHARPTVAQPAERASGGESISTAEPAPAAAPSELTVQPSQPITKPEPPRRRLKRPIDSWVIFRTAADPSTEVVCNYQWTGGDRLQVVTQNVTRLTLDLTKLPDGAPRRGPWNLQIDKQGIQITGVRGKVLDLIRSPNGIWSVDPEKSPRRD